MASNQRWHHDVAPSALPLTLAVALRLHIAISRMLSHSAALSIACAYTLSLDLLKARSLQGLLFLFRLAHRSHEVYSLTSLTHAQTSTRRCSPTLPLSHSICWHLDVSHTDKHTHSNIIAAPEARSPTLLRRSLTLFHSICACCLGAAAPQSPSSVELHASLASNRVGIQHKTAFNKRRVNDLE